MTALICRHERFSLHLRANRNQAKWLCIVAKCEAKPRCHPAIVEPSVGNGVKFD
jgi:hypothetical protein